MRKYGFSFVNVMFDSLDNVTHTFEWKEYSRMLNHCWLSIFGLFDLGKQ